MKLCVHKSTDGLSDSFIQLPEENESEKNPAELSCQLETGLENEENYLLDKDGIVIQTQKSTATAEDFSGAAPAIITEKLGKKKLKKLKREEREKTKGAGWFDMPALEMTEERKRDLELLQMRGAIDPKRFYKKSDNRGLPKYFQIGTVVDSPFDFYSDRIPTKARKRTMVDELLADAEFKKYNKRKYVQIIEERNRKQVVHSGKRSHGSKKQKKDS